MPALLVLQPTSTRGDDSVAVRIGNDTVGYLHHTTALEFLAALRPSKFDRARAPPRSLCGRIRSSATLFEFALMLWFHSS
jgi:hypothetical protein